MAANVTFDTFLAGMAALGTVNTGDGGFQQALGAVLLDSGKLKSWTSPAATAQQSSVLRARMAACKDQVELLHRNGVPRGLIPRADWVTPCVHDLWRGLSVERSQQIVPSPGYARAVGSIRTHPTTKHGRRRTWPPRVEASGLCSTPPTPCYVYGDPGVMISGRRQC